LSYRTEKEVAATAEGNILIIHDVGNGEGKEGDGSGQADSDG